MKKNLFGLAIFTAHGLCAENLFDVQQCVQQPSAGLPAMLSEPAAPSASAGHSSPHVTPSGTASVQHPATATVVDTLTFTVTTTRSVDPPTPRLIGPRPPTCAAHGDVVRFELRGRKLAIVQSSGQDPCRPNGQFDSRSQGHSDRGVYVNYTVGDLAPTHFYGILADEPQGCHAGLRFTINPGDDVQRSHQASQKTYEETNSSWNTTGGTWRRIRR
ncbi:hypothetical protein PG993_010768 [Apiospora rasikravindrae]|uniref:Secreted protein n=1 Tax=Apiospora rasikravindrae TaxID=990691 RepID=A0ABR1SCB9_9PEZI